MKSTEKHKIQMRKRYQNHKEEYKVHNKKRYQENPEHFKKYSKQYYLDHPEKCKENNKKWYDENKEKSLTTTIKWQKNHPEKTKETRLIAGRKHIKTSKGKLSKSKSIAKRHRNLGYEIINNIFPNSHGHHINKDQVIFIPSELHLAHYGHRLDRPETMIKINRVAFKYLTNDIKQI
jgi:hypothetical protein